MAKKQPEPQPQNLPFSFSTASLLATMNNHSERVESIKERTATSMYAFWSAMLTAHTMLLSVAVALPTATSSAVAWQFKLISVIAAICVLALVFNFAAIRMQYETIGRRLLGLDGDLSETQRRKDIITANRRRLVTRYAEATSAIGLIIEASLLAWFLLN